jgi:hypothetical protein
MAASMGYTVHASWAAHGRSTIEVPSHQVVFLQRTNHVMRRHPHCKQDSRVLVDRSIFLGG